MKDNKWYRMEVAKLMAIVHHNTTDGHQFIDRGYIIEKLDKILKEYGVSLHPALKSTATRFYEKE